MKQLFTLLIFLALFYFHGFAQDTIVLNNGNKVLAKHIRIRKKIFYKHFESYPHRKYDSVNKSEVNYVIHHSGWKIPMNPPPWLNPIVFDPGIGLSAIPVQFHNYFKDEGDNIISFSPVYSFNADYLYSQKFSVGIEVAWQSLKINPSVTHTYPVNPQTNTINYINYSVIESLTRLNIGCRLLYHIRNDDEKDFYLGIRPGLSFWTDNSNPPGTNPVGQTTKPSIMVLIGERKSINNYLGFFLEGGIGTPYFGEAGIYCKLNTVKK